jgi:hypothetical protein
MAPPRRRRLERRQDSGKREPRRGWKEFIEGKKSTPLRDIHVDPTYTVGKVLSIFLESVHFGFLGNLFGLLEHRRQNLTKVM